MHVIPGFQKFSKSTVNMTQRLTCTMKLGNNCSMNTSFIENQQEATIDHDYDNCDLKKGRKVHHYVLFDFNFPVFHSLLYKEKKL